MNSDDQFVNIGVVVKPHGIRGEVCVLPTTDWPEQFQSGRTIRLYKTGQAPCSMTLERVRVKHNQFIIKFELIDERSDAELLRGWNVQIRESERPELPEGTYYVSELVGMRAVSTRGESLGVLTDVIQNTAQDIYILDRDGKEILIPAVQEFVKEIQIENRLIVIDAIEGLLETNED